jgi:hypothetical protein
VLIEISFLFYLTFAKISPSVTWIVHSATEIVPSATEIVPSATEIVPSATEIVPSATEIVPSATEIVPSVTEIVPSATGIVPSATEIVPSYIEFACGIPNLRMENSFIKMYGRNIVNIYRDTGKYTPVTLYAGVFSTVHESRYKFHLRIYVTNQYKSIPLK